MAQNRGVRPPFFGPVDLKLARTQTTFGMRIFRLGYSGFLESVVSPPDPTDEMLMNSSLPNWQFSGQTGLGGLRRNIVQTGTNPELNLSTSDARSALQQSCFVN